ncbi:metal ABC transporter substrate-binding protein [Bacillus smithii]|uniref:metal ABC transporter substrate-binding protein n=1 Tax=Bacillus smithii TaxID=1479 RepID=UPI002E24FCB3|nr:metal ABC transporter substrate-binding protein [Bacillus smithii]MED1457865.1 metal ABC transporter substrate-binding protein [Bacillus smithii]MED1489496.1 metal ABC transporter substrate-binding protein [Bacillus smithii]
MKRFRFMVFLSLLMCSLAIAGCSNNESRSNSKDSKLHIATTFYPMYEFTKNITKDKAQVDLLIPANVEPHDWDPSPKDIEKIQKSDLLIYNSPELETWAPDLQKSINNVKFVNASKGISLIKGAKEEEEGDKGSHLDPHVWLDPVLAQKEVENITKAIVAKDPEHKAYYEKNSQAYIQQLKQLDHLYRTTLEKAPKKEFITQHTAFSYLAKEYGLKQVPISGLTPEQEPSPARLAELKKFAQKHQVKIIYFEEIASPKVAQTLANEVGAKTEVLSPLEGLTKEEQDKGLNYVKIMKRNLDSLKKSLMNP